MRRLKFAIIGLFLCVNAVAEGNPAPDEDLFQKGLAAYQNKQFAEARDLFLNVLEREGGSAPLYHDLALAYFQLDQKPYAMAFWRKALAADPKFALAHSGRQFLETKFNMRPFEKDSFNLWVRRTLEKISYYEILWVLALVIAATGWIWIRYLAARRIAIEDEHPKPDFPITAAALLTVFIGVVALAGVKLKFAAAMRATIILNQVSARSLPADDGVGLFELSGGSEVLVRRDNGDWLQVQNSDGASGWVKKEELLVTDKGVSL